MIECNCYLFDKKLDELGVKQNDTKAHLYFSASSLESVRETVLEDETEISKNHCMVYFKSGISYLIDKGYNEIKQLLQKHA